MHIYFQYISKEFQYHKMELYANWPLKELKTLKVNRKKRGGGVYSDLAESTE